MPIAHITDHVQAGLDLLIQEHKGKPRLEGLITAYLNRVQELENAIWSVIVGRLIDHAIGVQLDALGKLVGQRRDGTSDEVFRTRIRARIAANRSLGRPGDLIRVALLASALDPSEMFYWELQPATVLVELLELDPAVAPVVVELLHATKGPGIALQLLFTQHRESESFTFSDEDNGDVFDSARGFATNETPTTAPGGRWIDSL